MTSPLGTYSFKKMYLQVEFNDVKQKLVTRIYDKDPYRIRKHSERWDQDLPIARPRISIKNGRYQFVYKKKRYYLDTLKRHNPKHFAIEKLPMSRKPKRRRSRRAKRRKRKSRKQRKSRKKGY